MSILREVKIEVFQPLYGAYKKISGFSGSLLTIVEREAVINVFDAQIRLEREWRVSMQFSLTIAAQNCTI